MWIDALRVMKEQTDMTLEQISEESCVPLGTVFKVFAGQTQDPKLSTARAIMRAMGYCLNDVDRFDPDIENSPTEPKPDGGSKTRRIGELTPHESVLIDSYRSIDAHGVELVDYVVEHERRRCADGGQTLIAARGGGGIRKGKIPDEILNAPGSDDHEPGL